MVMKANSSQTPTISRGGGGVGSVDVFDLFELEKRYSTEIKQAKEFLENRKKVSNGSNLADTKVAHLIESNAQCPLCAITFEGANHNTEHIHPRGIGGGNTQENKIQLCMACNNSRNQVMQAVLGRPPYHKQYPENWTDIKRFLIWSLASIDISHRAAEQVPDMQRRFLEYRTGGLALHTTPSMAFHRSSTWRIGDTPNSPLNNQGKKRTKSQQEKRTKAQQEKRTGGFWTYIFDGIFGFNKERDTRRLKARTKPEPVEKKKTVEQLDFNNTIRDFLGDEEMSLVKLGSRMTEWQRKEGWEETGTKAFLERCGLKRGSGLRATIQKRMGDEVVITGESPKFLIRLSTTPATIVQEPKPESEPEPVPEPVEEPVEKPAEESDFDRIILDILASGEEMTTNILGHRLREWQEKQGWENPSSKIFLERCGLNRNMGLMNAIRERLGDRVIITGEEPPFTIRFIDSTR